MMGKAIGNIRRRRRSYESLAVSNTPQGGNRKETNMTNLWAGFTAWWYERYSLAKVCSHACQTHQNWLSSTLQECLKPMVLNLSTAKSEPTIWRQWAVAIFPTKNIWPTLIPITRNNIQTTKATKKSPLLWLPSCARLHRERHIWISVLLLKIFFTHSEHYNTLNKRQNPQHCRKITTR